MHLSAVRTLGLWNTSLGDAGLEAIAAEPGFVRIADLRVGNSRISDAGLRALAASPHACGLERLYIFGNPFSEAAVQALLDSPHLGRLAIVQLDSHRLPRPMQHLLQQRWSGAALPDLDDD
jgi:hypothetical protein